MINEEKRTQFIPLTLDNSNREFFSEGSWILLGCLILLQGILNVGVIALYNNNKYLNVIGTPVFLILGLIFVNWFCIFIIRKTVFKEKLLIRIYKDAKEYSVTNLSKFWGIYNIDDTRLMFVDGRIGTIIGMERGYKYGRPAGFEKVHYDCVTRFLREFLKNGYSIKYYNRSVNDANLDPLNDIERSIARMKGTGVYTIESAVIRHYRAITTTLADSEKEYYLITCRDINRINNLDQVCADAMSILGDSMYIGIHRLNEHELYGFIQDYYGLKYINVAGLIRDVFKRNNKRLVAIQEIIYQDSLDRDIESNELDERLGVSKKIDELLNGHKVDTSEEDYATYLAMKEAEQKVIEERRERARMVALARRGVDIHKTSRRKINKILKSISQEELSSIIDEMYKLDVGESQILDKWNKDVQIASELLHDTDITGEAPTLVDDDFELGDSDLKDVGSDGYTLEPNDYNAEFNNYAQNSTGYVSDFDNSTSNCYSQGGYMTPITFSDLDDIGSDNSQSGVNDEFDGSEFDDSDFYSNDQYILPGMSVYQDFSKSTQFGDNKDGE